MLYFDGAEADMSMGTFAHSVYGPAAVPHNRTAGFLGDEAFALH